MGARRGLGVVLVCSVFALLPNVAHGRSHFRPCADSAPFAAYWVGESFEGLPLTDRSYECQGPPQEYPVGRPNFVDLIYGDCDPGDDVCAFPLEIQTSPACDRWWSLLDLGYPGDPVQHPPLTSVRGVPAGRIEDGFGLDVYTGEFTATVFGDSRDRVRRAARALRLEGEPDPEGADLAAPIPGALHGRIDCGFRFSKLHARARRINGHPHATVRFGLPRPAHVVVELERRANGAWRSGPQAAYDAPEGESRHSVRIRTGRWRAMVTATTERGRRTQVRTLYFRTSD
jgi:hypothetical protein